MYIYNTCIKSISSSIDSFFHISIGLDVESWVPGTHKYPGQHEQDQPLHGARLVRQVVADTGVVGATENVIIIPRGHEDGGGDVGYHEHKSADAHDGNGDC